MVEVKGIRGQSFKDVCTKGASNSFVQFPTDIRLIDSDWLC